MVRTGERGDGLRDTDEILIQNIRAGNTESFEDLVSRYQRKVFAFAYRMVVSEDDARDLTQEVFLQVFRSLDSFRGEARFSTWLYRIAANKTLDFLRRKKAKLVPFPVRQDISGLAAAGSMDTNPELSSSRINDHILVFRPRVDGK